MGDSDTTAAPQKKRHDDKSALFWCDYHHLGANDVVSSWKKHYAFPENGSEFQIFLLIYFAL